MEIKPWYFNMRLQHRGPLRIVEWYGNCVFYFNHFDFVVNQYILCLTKTTSLNSFRPCVWTIPDILLECTSFWWRSITRQEILVGFSTHHRGDDILTNYTFDAMGCKHDYEQNSHRIWNGFSNKTSVGSLQLGPCNEYSSSVDTWIPRSVVFMIIFL